MNNIQLCYSDWKRMQEELNTLRMERKIEPDEVARLRNKLIESYGEETVKFVEDFAR